MAETSGKQLADNVALILIARAAIILGTAVGIPLAGVMLMRGLTTVDEISHKIDVAKDQAVDTNSTVKLIQQTQNQQSQVIVDHETRVRALESLSRASKTAAP